MTACTLRTRTVSANEIFKQRYPVYLRRAALVALAVLAVAWWTLPRHEPQPYRMRVSEVELIEIEPLVDMEEPLEAPPPLPPLPPIDVVDDPGLETPDWDFRIPDVPVGPVGGPGYTPPPESPFVASSRAPVLLAQPRPDYPEIARRAGLEGEVVVNILVGKDGTVLATEVARGAHPLLDRAAVRAARNCRFEPGLQREVPVTVWIAVPYRFRLH
jgi:protein TonB